ncbi:peptidase MA family metallohydrolase [Leeuwenhoekiella sp. A16]|uniref:peptidase MA family metallohydrolase n=1 Tax=unclassified Leeuwenhoekiella TaxID=2615029 RepID=UPI003A7F9D8B
MSTKKLSYLLLILSFYSCVKQKKIANDENWTKIVTETRTIDNITYNFPAEVEIPRRNLAIEECQKAIEENLKLIGETEFTNKMDIDFLKSRKEMLKFGGMAAQGLAYPDRDVFFTLLKDKGSPIKHEMMHMITMYKWGTPPNSSTWMNEGLATYSGGTCSKYSLEEIYKYFIQSDKLISMDKLSENFYENPDMIAYTQSAFICKFLIDNYGISKFKELWKRGFEKLNEIYGFDAQTLEKNLKDYVNQKYQTNIDFDWDEFNKGC